MEAMDTQQRANFLTKLTLMKNLAVPVLLLLGGFCACPRISAAPIVANGTFSANAAGYVNDPGYSGNANPAQITGWTTNETSFEPGINSYDAGLHTDFAPTGYSSSVASDPEYFAFLQYVTSTPTLKQTILLTAGAMYQLSFISAPRGGDAGLAGAGASISNSSLGLTLATQTYATASAYTGSGNFPTMPTTLDFTALGTGTSTITLTGPTGVISADIFPTEDFSDISITRIGNLPEPASYALLGLGLLALLVRKSAKV